MTLDEMLKQKLEKKQRLEKDFDDMLKKKLQENQSTKTNLTMSNSSRRKAYKNETNSESILANSNLNRQSYNSDSINPTLQQTSLPVAEKFKQQLETGKRVETAPANSLPIAKNISENLIPLLQKQTLNRVANIGKRTATGALQGIMGIPQAGITEVANNLEKGEQKNVNEIITDVLDSFGGILNPIQNFNNTIKKLPKLIENTVKTISDKDKNVLEKVTSLGTNAVSEATNENSAKRIFNSVTQGVGKILPSNTSNKVLDFNNQISKPVEELNQKLIEEAKNYDPITKTIGDVGQTVGNMAPSILATAITKNPNIGLATMGLNVKGQSTQEALNKGATLDEAIKIGDTKALIEIATEKLTGGINIFGKGAVDEIIEKGIDKKVKNQVANFLIKKGLDIPGEILEETISDVLGTAIDKGTVDPDAKYTLEDFGDTAVTTTLSTLVLNSLTGGYGKNAYISNKQQLNQQNKVIAEQNKMAQNQSSSQEKNILPIKTLNYEESARKYNIDTNNETVKAINNVTNQRGIQTRYDADMFTNNKTNAIWKTSTDANGNTVREVILNPNADTKKTLQNVIIHELTHDLEGTTEYKDLKDLILSYDEGNIGFENARKSLEDIYSKVYDKNSKEFQSLVENEAVADILGNKLGDQDFINTLTMEKPSTARRIYNWVIDKLNKINKLTGYSNEKLFWADVKNKFENAYRQDYQGNNTNTKYSTEILEDGTIYIKAENNKFIKADGTKMTSREVYQSLVGTTIEFPDGDSAKIVNRLPSKDIYNELSKRYPSKYNNVESIKEINNSVNENIEELLTNSTIKEPNVPDYKGRHQKQGITNFDTRTVKFYDGKNAYDIDFSIAILKDGSKVAYAKKYIEGNKDLTQKIKTVEARSEKSSLNQQSLSNNSIASENKDVNTTTKYSMQESENNSGSFSMQNNKDLSYQGNNGASGKAHGRNITVDKMTTEVEKIKEKYSKVIDSKDNEAIEQINKAKNNPNAEITIYRGSLNGEINEGDWVFLSKARAERYTKTVITGKPIPGYEVGELKVKAKDVDWTGKNLEFVYEPQTTDNPDIRYSQNNTTWQEYLNKNYKNTGKGQTIQDVKLPTKEYFENRSETKEEKKNDNRNMIPGWEDANLPKTKQELLENNSNAINNYIKEKNNSIRKIEAQINKKQEELNIKTDKDSMIANKIKAQIIELNKRKKDIELLYNKKIENAFNKGEKIIESEDMSRRKNVIQQNRELAREKIKNISTWKDKSSGIKYQRETMERNMYDIIPNKEEAQDIIDTYFEPIHKSEAEKQRFINKYNDKIKALKINKYESEAIQFLGEQKYNPDFKSDEITQKVAERIIKNENKGRIDKKKVYDAIELFRNMYDELFDLENRVLVENGYPPKPYRKGYFPHFIDVELFTKTEKFLDKLGFKIDKRPLPTDIAGTTEQFVPGKTWNRSSLKRKTDKTTYNALKGFDTYISQAADNIFHTNNIQKLRALENEIRYQYSDKGIQERIDQIYNDEVLNQEEQQAAIEKIFEQIENPMPNLVTEIRRYTNALANKKSEADRSAEQKYGRQVYSTVNAIENRFGANAVALNIGSAVTNFIPITQAYSQIGTKNMGKATIDTIKSYIKDDGFIDKSTFLTNRLKQSEKLYKTTLEKISDKTSFLFNSIDSVTSNIVVRGKYLENISKGMDEVSAMKNADNFAANVMADRSKGSLPTLFEEKSPITKIFTQFQLEVNNQYSYMFKDIPRDLKEKGLGSIALAFFKMFVAAWAYNWASEELTGRKPAFSPIDIAVSSYKTISDSETKTADKVINIGQDIVEELPFVGGFFGGGRIPISGALPNAENTFKATVGLATGEMNSNKAVKTLGKELSKPMFYILPPFGGGQAKKTIEGIETVKNKGSYGVDSKGEGILQFPVENANIGDYLKAGVFGKYSLPLAKEYADRNYKSLNAKQTKIYKESNIPYKELLDYIDKKLTKKIDKITYIEGQNLNEQQKWGIYKYDILSNIKRDDGGSQLSDAEYIISNGISKTEYMNIYNKAQKNDIDIPTEKEYKKMQKAGINLNNYIDYKTKEKEQLKTKRAKGELSKQQDLKDKDKIQILLDSNYTNKEISAIYENYILSSTNKTYSIIKQSGIDTKQYLRYVQQEFESDTKDDGTLKRKSNNK